MENAVPKRTDGGGHVLQVSGQDLGQQHRRLGHHVRPGRPCEHQLGLARVHRRPERAVEVPQDHVQQLHRHHPGMGHVRVLAVDRRQKRFRVDMDVQHRPQPHQLGAGRFEGLPRRTHHRRRVLPPGQETDARQRKGRQHQLFRKVQLRPFYPFAADVGRNGTARVSGGVRHGHDRRAVDKRQRRTHDIGHEQPGRGQVPYIRRRHQLSTERKLPDRHVGRPTAVAHSLLRDFN